MHLRFHSKNKVYLSDKTALQMSDSIFHNDVHVQGTAAWVLNCLEIGMYM